MPVRNGMQYITKALRIISSNLTEIDELVIVDDSSTDGTYEFLKNIKIPNLNLRVLKNRGSGIAQALDTGIRSAENNWIARFDVDDEYPSNRISLQRAEIRGDIGAIFCDYRFASKNRINLGVVPSGIVHEAILASLYKSVRTPHPGVLLNREAVNEVGGYKSNEFPAEDLGLWFRLRNVSKLISVPQILLFYNLTPGSISLSRRKQMLGKKLELSFLNAPKYSELEKIQNRLPEIFSIYENYEQCERRKLLLASDIYSLGKFFGNREVQKFGIKNLTKLMTQRNNQREIFNLLAERKLRQEFRKMS